MYYKDLPVTPVFFSPVYYKDLPVTPVVFFLLCIIDLPFTPVGLFSCLFLDLPVSRFIGLCVHLASMSGVCVCVRASSLSNCSWRINQSAPAAARCAAYIRLEVCVSVVGLLILSCFLSALCVPASRPACTGLVCTHL